MAQKSEGIETTPKAAKRTPCKAVGPRTASANGAVRAASKVRRGVNSSGQVLHSAAERHGEVAEAASLDALSQTLDMARGEPLGSAARKTKSLAEELAQATADAEFNLR